MRLLEDDTDRSPQSHRSHQSQTDERDERAVRLYVERFGDVLTDAGMPRLAARVFAQLLADDDGRMTSTELTESLGVSPAAISGAIRYLAHAMLIGKERERGSRRDVYVVQTDAWHTAMLSRDRLLSQMESSVRDGVDAVGPDTRAGRRLRLTVEYFDYLFAQMESIRTGWEERKAAIIRDWPTDH
jgi:DNA-binding MarR family transcriptional regulator